MPLHFHWPFLFGALILLAPPAPFSADLQKSLLSMRRNSSARAAGAVRVWQNWFDFARAALGAYLLTLAIVPVPGNPNNPEVWAVLIQAGILILVVLAQTVRFFRTVQFLAPVFYLCGLTLFLGGDFLSPLTSRAEGGVLSHLQEAEFQGLFAVAVGWIFAIFGKSSSYQLPAMAMALVAAGYVLGYPRSLLLGCALIMLPPFLSALFRRRLLFVTNAPVRV